MVTFGDSTTAPRNGVISYTEQIAPRFLGYRQAPRFVHSAGNEGETTVHARQRFQKEVLNEQPAVVVIQFGINDSMADVWLIPPTTTPRTPLAVFEENIRFFVKECRAVGASVILMTPQQVRWTPKLRKLFGRRPYQPEEERGFCVLLEEYVAVVRKVACEWAVPFVDLYALYDMWEQTHLRSSAELLVDGIHPNTAGHALAADALLPLVQRVLYVDV